MRFLYQRMPRWALCGAAFVVCSSFAAEADLKRRTPPVGLEVPSETESRLRAGLRDLSLKIESIRTQFREEPDWLRLLPDVEIFHKAVFYALEHREFYRTNEFDAARELIQEGGRRAVLLMNRQSPWTRAPGLAVRGYRSRIDGSVQPYGLVVPEGYRPDGLRKRRLDVWLHGRDDRLTELKFIRQRMSDAGPFTPDGALVLHPYGRYCNAFKFAGEVDVLEALEHVQRNYFIDDRRIAVRGFSMGGGGCWHLSAHHAGRWAAAAPGAGFAETFEYLNIASRDPQPPWYEKRLWHWYDATDYALNYFNLPLAAYSGENDKQIQAARVMESALEKEGMKLAHVIGPQTGHKYHPDSKRDIVERMDGILETGRDPLPREIRFATWTLRYPRMRWIELEGLEEHWKQARVQARFRDGGIIEVDTENVSRIRLSFPPGKLPWPATLTPAVILDGQEIKGDPALTDRSWSSRFHKDNQVWRLTTEETGTSSEQLRKVPGLQGPIDDAFLDSFVFVRPTGEFYHDRVKDWILADMERAVREWRNQFRGEARVIDDVDLAESDYESNLILWGDPSSNRYLGECLAELPIEWSEAGLSVNGKVHDATRSVPKMIYPNPRNPERYIVLNSGFTFPNPVSSSNADQTPKLPDWAVADIDDAPLTGIGYAVKDAGFFDESWQFKKDLENAGRTNDEKGRVSFIRDIAPVFHAKCAACHNAEKAKGGYRVDAYTQIVDPSARVIVPGKPGQSYLLELLLAEEAGDRMPQEDDPLPPETIERVRVWIQEGAKFDGQDPAQALAELLPRDPYPDPPTKYTSSLPARALALHPDGEQLWAAGYHEIIIRNLSDPLLMERVSGLPQRVHAIVFDEEGNRAAIGGGVPGRIGEAFMMDARTRELHSLRTAADSILDVDITSDGTRIAAGGADRALSLHDAASGSTLQEIRQHADWILALSFNRDGTLVGTASRDGTARVFNVETGENLSTFRGHNAAVTGIVFLEDAECAATSGADGRIRFWDWKSGNKTKASALSCSSASLLRAPGNLLLYGGEDGIVRLAEASGSRNRKELNGNGAIYSLAFDSRANRWIAGFENGAVRIGTLDPFEWREAFSVFP